MEHEIILNNIPFFPSQCKFPFFTTATIARDMLVLRSYIQLLSEAGMSTVVFIAFLPKASSLYYLRENLDIRKIDSKYLISRAIT